MFDLQDQVTKLSLDYIHLNMQLCMKNPLSPTSVLLAKEVAESDERSTPVLDSITLLKRIQISMLRYLESCQNKVESLEQSLILLNPNEILSRGYAIAFNEKNKAITNVEKISLNDKIKIKLHYGLVTTSVTDKTNG